MQKKQIYTYGTGENDKTKYFNKNAGNRSRKIDEERECNFSI